MRKRSLWSAADNFLIQSLALSMFVLGILVTTELKVSAQSYSTATGIPNFAAPEPVEMGFADTANGELRLTIHMGSYSQRGSDQPEEVNLIYDSNIWRVLSSGSTYIWDPSNAYGESAGWNLSEDIQARRLPGGTTSGCRDDEVWQDRNGTAHVFALPTNPWGNCTYSGSAYATDSSGFLMTVFSCQNALFGCMSVYAPDGTLVWTNDIYSGNFTDASGHYIMFKDRNGNYLATDSLTSNNRTFWDTLGRVFVAPNFTLSTSQGTSQYQVVYATIPLNTHFQKSGVSECANPYCTAKVIRSITLPDQAHSTYYFTYNCDSTTGNAACGAPGGQTYYYGELKSVTLPSGGTINYSYTMFKDAYQNNVRWLSTRTSAGGTWTYTPKVLVNCSGNNLIPPAYVGCTQQTTVQKPTGASNVYTFTLNNGAWPTTIVAKDTNGVVLSQVDKTWDFSQSCVTLNCHGASYIRLLTDKTTIPRPGGNLIKQSTYGYDSAQHGNKTSIKEWLYTTSGSFGSVPDRATYVSYLSTTNNNINRPTVVTLCNNLGSDVDCPGGGSKLSQTKTVYDSYGTGGLTVVSGTSQHDDTRYGNSYITRGNPTKISRWVSGSTYLDTTYSYDTTGQVLTETDPKGNTINYGYGDRFYTDPGNDLTPAAYTPAKPTNAFRTSVTDAIGTETIGYYYGSGNKAIATGYNGVSVYAHYQDGMDRKTEEYSPAPGLRWNLMNYSSTTVFDAYTAVTDPLPSSGCSSCRHKQVLFDSWGRKTAEVLVNNPIGPVNMDSAYDSNGRIKTMSHAYSGSSDPNHVFETLTYDGLDRKISALHPDGQQMRLAYGAQVTNLGGLTSQTSTAYGLGYPTISEDEALKQKQQWLDGFGRVIEVDEPSTNSGTPGTKSVTVNQGTMVVWYDPCEPIGAGSCSYEIDNRGTVTLTVNGYSASADYYPGITAQSLASQLAGGLSAPGSPVTAAVNGSSITMTAVGAGTSTNFSFTSSATYNNSSMCGNQQCFTSAGMWVSPSSGTFTGGSGGIGSSPFSTFYAYDAADNLAKVVQGVQTRIFSYDGLGRKISEQTPEGGTVTLSYTASGGGVCAGDSSRVCQRTDARGVITTYSYDAMSRLTGASYAIPQGSGVDAMPNVCTTSTGTQANICYYYDQGGAAAFALGQLTSTVDATGSQTSTYDAAGRATQVSKVIGSNTYNTQYQYNLADEVTQIKYPSGRIVQQGYNAVGQTCAVATAVSTCNGSNVFANSYSYDPAGRVLGFNYGNGVAASFAFSPAREQLNTLAYAKGTTNYFNLKYWYQKDSTNCANGSNGDDGQVQCITDNVDSARNLAYGYDALGRMTSASIKGSTGGQPWDAAWNMTETYDRFGNRWTQAGNNVFNTSLAFGPTGMNSSTNNRPNGYTYDLSGNLTVEPLAPPNNFTYDGENRMTQFSGNGGSATYSYDANDLRVKRVVSGGVTTVSIFSGSSVIAEYDNGALPGSPSREYIFSDGKMLAMVSGGVTTYYHGDHLSTRLTTDGGGIIQSQEGHFPFGEPWYQTSGNKWFFTTYNRDSESGMDYALARYYDSRTGTFGSADPLTGSPGDPQSWNRYVYGRNDPIDITDPSGKFAFIPLLILFASNFMENIAIDFVANTIQGNPGIGAGDLEGAALGAGLSVGESFIPMPKAKLMKQPGRFFLERAPIDFAERSFNSFVSNEAINGQARVDWAGAAIGTGLDMLDDFITYKENSPAKVAACASATLAKIDQQFGTQAQQVGDPWQFSTGAPDGTGTVNVNVSIPTNQPGASGTGYYGGTFGPLHVVSGAGGHGGLDSSNTLRFTSHSFTGHIDSGNPGKTAGIGAAWHFLRDMSGIGGYRACP